MPASPATPPTRPVSLRLRLRPPSLDMNINRNPNPSTQRDTAPLHPDMLHAHIPPPHGDTRPPQDDTLEPPSPLHPRPSPRRKTNKRTTPPANPNQVQLARPDRTRSPIDPNTSTEETVQLMDVSINRDNEIAMPPTREPPPNRAINLSVQRSLASIQPYLRDLGGVRVNRMIEARRMEILVELLYRVNQAGSSIDIVRDILLEDLRSLDYDPPFRSSIFEAFSVSLLL